MSLKGKCDQYDTLVKELFRILDIEEETDRDPLIKELGEVLNLLKSTMEGAT